MLLRKTNNQRGRYPSQNQPASAGRERAKTVKKEEMLITITSILEARKKQIGWLSQDQVGGLSRYQIGWLSQDQIGWLSQDQVGWLSRYQIGGLSSAVLEAIKERLES